MTDDYKSLYLDLRVVVDNYLKAYNKRQQKRGDIMKKLSLYYDAQQAMLATVRAQQGIINEIK